MTSFLEPLLRKSSDGCALVNNRTGVVLADRLIPAFDSAARRTGLYKQLLPRLEALPGVQSATLLYFSLLSNGSVSYAITASGSGMRADDPAECYLMEVGPRYFETMKMPILAGRAFGAQDERPMAEGERPPVMKPGYLAGATPLDAVVNQAMARHYFSDSRVLGKHITFDGDTLKVCGSDKKDDRPSEFATNAQRPRSSAMMISASTSAAASPKRVRRRPIASFTLCGMASSCISLRPQPSSSR